MFAGKKHWAWKFYLVEINPAKSIFLYRYLPTEKCDVSVDLYVLPHIRYKWLRGQRKTVGKSICIHLSLLSSVESANYFSAGLKALSLCSVAKGAWLVQPRMPAEWPMIWTDNGWMTDGERWLRWMAESHTKNEGWNIMLKGEVKRVGPYLFLWQPQHTHVALCSALQTLGQKVAYLEYHQDRLWLVHQVWGGGGTELTCGGSSLLIEWWKNDREWDGLTLMDV